MSTLVFPSLSTPAPPKAPLVQDYITSGTWTKPDGARLVWVEIVGAGGPGSASNFNGGGAGGYTDRLFQAADLAASYSITIAAGGTDPIGAAGATSALGVSMPGGYGGQKTDAGSNGRGAGSELGGIAYSDPGTGAGAYRGGRGGPNLRKGGDSLYGAGGGGGGRDAAGANLAGGLGGTSAAAEGRLQAGDGGFGVYTGVAEDGHAPGGGGGGAYSSGGTPGIGARGAVRITTYF